MNIERYTHPKVDLYLNDKFVMTLNNEVELLRVRIEICKNALKGYKLKFKDQFTEINYNGEILKHFKGMFDESDNLITEYFCLQAKKLEINFNELN